MLEKASNKKLPKNVVGATIGTELSACIVEWRAIHTRLVAGEIVGGRLKLGDNRNNNGFIHLLPIASSSTNVASSTPAKPTTPAVIRQTLIDIVEAEIRKVVGAAGSVLVDDVGGSIRGRQQCTSEEEWSEFVKALVLWQYSNRNIVSGPWHVAIKVGSNGESNKPTVTPAQTSASESSNSTSASSTTVDPYSFDSAVTFCIEFVKSHPLCHVSLLGVDVSAMYGPFWKRIREELPALLARLSKHKVNHTNEWYFVNHRKQCFHSNHR